MPIAKPFQTHFPIPLTSLPTELPLPFALYLKVNGRHVKFREINDCLTQKRLSTLRKSVEFAFVSEGAWKTFLLFLDGIYPVDLSNLAQATKNFRPLILAYAQYLDRKDSIDRGPIQIVRNLSQTLVDLDLTRTQLYSELLHHYLETSLYFAAHSVNVAVYSLAIAARLGMRTKELNEIAFAALTHNIGNSTIPDEILLKSGKLNELEWNIVKSHTNRGAELLQYFDAPTQSVLTAEQHHENVDGTGYPNALVGTYIHPFAKICSIADVYDALTSWTPAGNRPLSPNDALLKMQTMKGKFDPQILKFIGPQTMDVNSPQFERSISELRWAA